MTNAKPPASHTRPRQPKPSKPKSKSQTTSPHPNEDPSYPYYFFYGHEATNPTGALSQWHDTSFREDGRLFRTAEHYMMYHKAVMFEGDGDVAEAVLAAPGPREAKKLGRGVKGFEKETWEARCDAIVEQGNYLKFTQNEAAWAVLCPERTRDKMLVEASPRDAIWGIGMGWQTAPGREAEWGENRLGKALTRVRARITAEKGKGK